MKLEIDIDACDMVRLADISNNTNIGICEVAQKLMLVNLYDEEFEFSFSTKMVKFEDFKATNLFHKWILEQIVIDFPIGFFQENKDSLIGAIDFNTLVLVTKNGLKTYKFTLEKGLEHD